MPRSLTSFVGRDGEVAGVAALLERDDVALVTLIGPGGVGKTRLALQIAARHRARGADAVAFVPLADVREPDLVLPTIAQRLAPWAAARAQDPDLLPRLLARQPLLLVLDNVEQVVAASPGFARLLAACPRLTMLVTSRVRLGLASERLVAVAPFPVPALPGTVDPDAVGALPAIQLFTERARAARPEFALTAANAAAVAEVCRRLDGLPLALELAAARLHVLSLPNLLARLEQRLPMLTGGARDMPERQQTIRATIAWSHDLLSPEEQRFFRRMAVFVGGFTLEAAEAMGAALGDGEDVLATLTTLVEHSLVLRRPGDADGRFAMLETVREFGLECLAASGEEDAVRMAQVHALLDLARAVQPTSTALGQFDRALRLGVEIGNLRAALAWLDQTGEEALLLQLTWRLQWLWNLVAPTEGVRWYDRLLAGSLREDDPAYLDILRFSGLLMVTMTPDSATGLARLAQARERAAAAGNGGAMAEVAFIRGIAAEDRGDAEAAAALLDEARAWYAQTDQMVVVALVDYHRGIVAYGRGDLDEAATILRDARDLAAAAGGPVIRIWCDLFQVLVSCDQRDPGEAAAALRRCRDGLDRIAASSQSKHLVAAAVLAAAICEDSLAAMFFGAVLAEGWRVPLAWPESVTVARVAADVRARLGETAFTAAATLGRNRSETALLAEIERLLTIAAAAPASRPAAGAAPVTPRELDVLRLLVEGKSDREIAAALFISPRTVGHHVNHIVAKLGVESRTAAAAWAVRHGIV